MKPFGSVVSAVIGLAMALVLVAWAVVAVVLISVVRLAMSVGGSLLRGARHRFHEPPPSQPSSTPDGAMQPVEGSLR